MNYKVVLLIPIFEILSFILLGDFLGFWIVVSLIFLTGFIGLFLIRSELKLRQIEKLVSEPNDWLFKKIAGFLLIIPGFVTDFLGIIMLVKPLRGYVWKNFIFKKSFNKNNEARKNKDENIIDADYRDLDEK